MLHELPNGKILVFIVDLSALSPDEYDRKYDEISNVAYSVQQFPKRQALKVFWNYVEPPSAVLSLPQDCVVPYRDNR